MGTARGLRAALATDGQGEYVRVEIDGQGGKNAVMREWSSAAVLFGSWEFEQIVSPTTGKKKTKKRDATYRYLELIPGPELQRVHLEELFWVHGHFEVIEREYRTKPANAAFKAYKRRLSTREES